MTKKQYLSYTIDEPITEKQEIWVAMLEELGFSGFEQTDNGVTAIGEKGELDEAAIETFFQENDLLYTRQLIDEQNWNAQWESSFEPIVVGNFCAVRAHFHQPVAGIKHEIIITPKMSFGTGHHATTYMMMQEMEQLDFVDKDVIDFGTGTGILAILAEKMGAANIEAIDYDEWCIENGTENIQANACSHIQLIKANAIDIAKPADIILANINKNIILDNIAGIKAKTKPRGYVLLSGLLLADEADIEQAALQQGFKKVKTVQQKGWICILFVAQPAVF